MIIHLLRSYRGKLTGEKVIPPGHYDDSDPRIFGLAAYLVENGHAVEVEREYLVRADADESFVVDPDVDEVPVVGVGNDDGVVTLDDQGNDDAHRTLTAREFEEKTGRVATDEAISAANADEEPRPKGRRKTKKQATDEAPGDAQSDAPPESDTAGE